MVRLTRTKARVRLKTALGQTKRGHLTIVDGRAATTGQPGSGSRAFSVLTESVRAWKMLNDSNWSKI
jgi:hypothetical protein